jgi:hypothetical protein
MEWMITGGNQKLISEVDRLAKDVLGSKDFWLHDIANFSARTESKRLDLAEERNSGSLFPGDGWMEKSVHIMVLTGRKNSEGLSQPFTIPGLYMHSLCKVSPFSDLTRCRPATWLDNHPCLTG